MRFLLLVLILLLSGCATAEPPRSAWGDITLLGLAQNGDAPVLAAQLTGTQDVLLAGWIRADESRLMLSLSQRTAAAWAAPLDSPLPLVRPRDLMALNVDEGRVHLLWLDEDYRQNRISGSETRLIAALIDPVLNTERGPTLASDRPTYHFTAAYAGDGGLWLVWSGGSVVEPALFVQQLDAAGRPLEIRLLISDGDFPTLIRANDGTLWLVWITHDGRVRRCRFTEGSLSEVQTLTTFERQRGVQWVDFLAGMSARALHLFWNVINVEGQPETWMTTAPLSGDPVPPPTLLRLHARAAVPDFETGYNGGFAFAVLDGGASTPLHWAAPLAQQQTRLPVAVWDGVRLGIAYLDTSGIVAYQPVVDVPLLFGAPSLLLDRDQHFSLAWAQPRSDGFAEMRFTSTRQG